MPIVSGDGPRDDPNAMLAVRNSKLPTLSALEMDDVVGLILPRTPVSDRRDGGRGIAILLADVGVGICRLLTLLRLADAGAEALISPISEKMSPKSAYLKTNGSSLREQKPIPRPNTSTYSKRTALGFATARTDATKRSASMHSTLPDSDIAEID